MKTPKEHTELLKFREGFVGSVYNDSTNNPTIGYGHKIKKGENFTTLTKEQADELFMKDYLNAQQGADRIIQEFKIPAEDNVRNAVTGAVFQLGEEGFKKFKKTIAFLQQGNFEEAAKEVKNSDWHKQTPVRTSDFENLLLNKQKGGFIDMQEGGNVESQGMVTSLDTGVIQNETPTTIDTTQGFYSVNPAPGETAAEFAKRNPLPTVDEQLERLRSSAQVSESNYRSPASYVSPRITNQLSQRLNLTDTGDFTSGTTLADQLASSVGVGPSDDDIAYTDTSKLAAIETIDNFMLGSEAADMVNDAMRSVWTGPNFWGGVSSVPLNWTVDGWIDLQDKMQDWTKTNFVLAKNLQIVDTDGNLQTLGTDRNLWGFGDESTWIRETDLVWDAAYGMTKEEALPFNEYMENIDNIRLNKTFTFTTQQNGQSLDSISKNTGISKKVIVSRNEKLFNDKYGVTSANAENLGNIMIDQNENLTLPQRLKRSAFKQKLDSMGDWFTKVKNTELGSLPGNTRVTLGNIADDMFAGLAAGFLTPDGKFDAERFAIAGAGSFTRTNVIDSYASEAIVESLGNISVGDIATKLGLDISKLNADQALTKIMQSGNFKKIDELVGKGTSDTVKAAQNASKHIKAIGGSVVSAITTLGLGGDTEDALKAGALTAGGVYGAEYLVQDVGLLPGPAGAIIRAALAALQGGGVEEVGKGAAYGYMLSNPATAPFAYGLMALEFILGMKKPSNKTAYYTFDLDDFEGLSFSQGDYDPSKANENNVKFMKELGEPLIPIVKGLEEASGMNLIGDIQLHYGGRDGLYYTIGSRDISGTPEQMIVNRLDYFDGKDQSTADGGSVYRSKRFQADETGISKMYEELLGELSYIVKNNITDLANYTGKKLTMEETRELLASSSITPGIKDGGKILDRNQKVLYNSNQAKNYGLVDKKGKAPPSARADDVPMTLKEGDFVLSQPAVALYGEGTINRMVQRAANEAGTNLKSGSKVPVNVHNGEYIIPKKLTEYIGSNVLENMNNRGLMSVGERPNT